MLHQIITMKVILVRYCNIFRTIEHLGWQWSKVPWNSIDTYCMHLFEYIWWLALDTSAIEKQKMHYVD